MNELNATAHKILDVAERLTQLHGFNAFSYKALQDEVGVKTSTIHYYFPTKQDLALRLVERHGVRFAELLKQIDGTHTEAIGRINALAQVYIDTLSQGKFCMCGMLASDLLALPEQANQRLQDFFQQVEAWLAKALVLGQEQGRIQSGIDIEGTASLLLSTLEGGMLIARAHGSSAYLEHVMSTLMQQIGKAHTE